MYKLIVTTFLLCALTVAGQARAGDYVKTIDLTLGEQNKTTPEVIQLAKSLTPQKLLVRINIDDIHDEEQKQKRLKSLDVPDEEIKLATKNAIRSRKDKIFPKNKLGNSKVTEDFPNLGTLEVVVKDYPTLTQILSNPDVKTVTSPRVMRPSGISYNYVGQPAVNISGYRGSGASVAMLDTSFPVIRRIFSSSNSFPACHDEYTPNGGGDAYNTGSCRIVAAVNFAYGGAPQIFDAYSDNSGTAHGEGVAGVIATFAPGAWIVALQVFDRTGYGTETYAVRAMEWLVANGTFYKVAAVNLSLEFGTPLYSGPCPADPMSDEFMRVISVGIFPVAATGNSHSLTGISSPSCAVVNSSGISVGAVTDSAYGPQSYPKSGLDGCNDGSLAAGSVPCFSNSGGFLAGIHAPGVLVYVDGTNIITSGTSIAAPHVAAAAAILKGTNSPHRYDSVQNIKQTLIETAKPGLDQRTNTQIRILAVDVAMNLATAKVSINPTSTILYYGTSTQLMAVSAANDNTPIGTSFSWNSDNVSVVAVDQNGNVTAGTPGTATITATSANGRKGSSVITSTKDRHFSPSCQANPASCK